MNARCGSWIKGSAIVLVGVAIGVAMPGAQPTTAKEVKKVDPPRIGYVNIAKVLKDYKRANAEGAKITKRRQGYVEQVTADRKAIEELTDQFGKTDDGQLKQVLQEQALAIQARIEKVDAEAQKELTELSNVTIVAVYDQIRSVIGEIAKDRGLDVIEAYPGPTKLEDEKDPQVAQLMLQTPALIPFYLNPELDFTAEVVVRVNKKFPPEKEVK